MTCDHNVRVVNDLEDPANSGSTPAASTNPSLCSWCRRRSLGFDRRLAAGALGTTPNDNITYLVPSASCYRPCRLPFPNISKPVRGCGPDPAVESLLRSRLD